MRKINKNGKMGAGTIAVSIILIALLSLAVFGIYGQNIAGGSDTDAESCGDSTATITYTAKNEYSRSSSVSGLSVYGKIGDGAIQNLSAVTSLPVGAVISDIFYSAGDYIDAKAPSFTVACGQTTAPIVNMKPTSDPSTYLIKNDAGTTLTDTATGGASNGTSTAGTLELELRIGATTDVTTGNLYIVMEYDNSTEVDEISLSGTGVDSLGNAVPESYTKEASNSVIRSFKIAEIEDGATGSFTIKLTPESGQTIGGSEQALRTTIYSEQAFEQPDGTVGVGVEDSDGSDKSEDSSDYDVFIL